MVPANERIQLYVTSNENILDWDGFRSLIRERLCIKIEYLSIYEESMVGYLGLTDDACAKVEVEE
ncbi:hypothetical protein D3C76_1495860 [compost metagenome]